jgi:hypothetical protein
LLLRQTWHRHFPTRLANTVPLTQEAGRSVIFWLSGRVQADGTLIRTRQ